VRYALVGEVAGDAAAPRVDARLVETTSSTVVWGDSFVVPRGLAHRTPEIVAMRLAPALMDKVVELEVARIARSPPSVPDALDYVLLASGEAIARRPGWPARADELLKKALASDGRSVPAMVTRASLLAFLAKSSRSSAERQARVDEASRLALRAVTADPECAASWMTRASMLAAAGHIDAAITAADKAVRLNPANAWVVSQRLALLLASGRAREAILPLEEVEFVYEKLDLAEFMRVQCLARVQAPGFDDAPDACRSWYALNGDAEALAALAAAHADRGMQPARVTVAAR
jgi:tetratricopeptide (TPR) repeat protein